jgi:hypothetical protein
MAERLRAKWFEDKAAEQKVRSLGFTGRWEMVRIADINEARSKDIMARMNRHTNSEVVQRYARAMESGDAFPGGVLCTLADGSLAAVAGNHRTVAASEVDGPDAMMLMFVIDVRITDQMANQIGVLLNLQNGIGYSKADLYEVAARGVVEMSGSIRELAAAFDLAMTTLTRYVKIAKFKRYCDGEGIPIDGLDMGAIAHLSKLASSVPACKRAVELSRRYNLDESQVKALVEAGTSDELHSDKARLDAINGHCQMRYGAPPTIAKPKAAKRTYSRVIGHVNTLRNYVSRAASLADFEPADRSELEAMRDSFRDLANRLYAVSTRGGSSAADDSDDDEQGSAA